MQQNKILVLVLMWMMARSVLAQNAAPVTDHLALLPLDTKQTVVKKGAISSLDIICDPGTQGGDTVDIVTSDSTITVTLTTPNGLHVTSTNAANSGLQWTTLILGADTFGAPSTFDAPGIHTIISFPAGSTPGTYQISFDGTNLATDSPALVTYLSSSTVKAGLVSDVAFLPTGQSILLNGLVFDDTVPIAGAHMTVNILPKMDVTGQVTLGGYALANRVTIDSSTVAETFTVQLTNNGSPLTSVAASLNLQTIPAATSVDVSRLMFGDVGTGASAQSTDTLTVTHNSTDLFDPTSLSWRVQAAGTPYQVSLSDSGQYDAQTGDGAYSGTFTPSMPGEYVAVLSATGLSNSGSSFSRTAATTFTVTAPLANFSSIQSELTTNPMQNVVQGITANATVSVQTAGTYTFVLSLQASNGRLLTARSKAPLDLGTQVLSAHFAADDLQSLGVDGPFQLTNAELFYQGRDQQILADSQVQAGATPALALTSFDPGPISVTNQNSVTGVASPSGSTYDTLEVTIGVATPGGSCAWSGSLQDAAGNVIDTVFGSDTLPSGSGIVKLDFNGQKIALAQIQGSLKIGQLEVNCSGSFFPPTPPSNLQLSQVFQTQPFTSSQFTSGDPDGLTLMPAAAVAKPGSTVSGQILFVGPDSWNTSWLLSVNGAPDGVTAQFNLPRLIVNGSSTLQVTVAPTVAPGTYPLQITATGNGKTHSFTYRLTVTQSQISVSLSPGYVNLSGGQTQQFTGLVSNTRNQGLIWSVQPPVGIIDANGLYTAPTEITATTPPVLVTASSVLDPSKSASAYVSLQLGIAPLTADVSTVAIPPGSSGVVQVSRSATSNYFDIVSLSISGLPDGASASFNQNSLSGTASSVLSISTALDALPGTYLLTITGDGGSFTQSTTITLIIGGGDYSTTKFTLTSSNPLLVVQPNTSATATLTVATMLPYHEQISFSVSGLPSGAIYDLSTPTLAGSGEVTLSVFASVETAPGSYPVTITGAGASFTQVTSINLVILPSPANIALPSGWSSQDVGQTGMAGTANFGAGVFSIQGSGKGMPLSFDPTPDQFEFAFTALLGDGSIVARLIQNGATGAGLMIRDTLDPDSAYVLLGPAGSQSLQYRLSLGSKNQSDSTAQVSSAVPTWLKLIRQGSSVTGYTSWDGTNWAQAGQSVNVAFGQNLYVGLAVFSASPDTLVNAAFDHVTVTSSQSGFSLASSESVTAVASGTATATVTQYAASGFADTVTLSANGLPPGATIAFSPPVLTDCNHSVVSFTMGSEVSPGTYPIVITGTSANQVSSTKVLLTVLAPLPSGWSGDDVGSVGQAGQSATSNGIFTLTGSGLGPASWIFESDQFHDAFTSVRGDAVIVARLTAVKDPLGSATAGIMIRNSLDSESSDVWLYYNEGTLNLSHRVMNHIPEANYDHGQFINFDWSSYQVQPPIWLKLIRRGNQFTGYTSQDGVQWSQCGDSVTATMGPTIYVGLAVSSGDNLHSASASFDNVSISTTPAEFEITLASPTLILPAQGDNSTQMIVTGISNFADTVNLSLGSAPYGVTTQFDPSSVTGSGSGTLTVNGLIAGTYQLTILGSSSDYTQAATLTVVVPAPAPDLSLPYGWTDTDIGPVSVPGLASFSHTSNVENFVVQGSGADPNGMEDKFHYAFTSLTGDGGIIAHLARIQGAGSGSRIGITMRNTADATSNYASLLVLDDGKFSFISRDSANGGSITVGQADGQAPEWLRLIRQGNVFLAFTSVDGDTWSQVGSPVAVQMNQAVTVGLAVSSGNNNSLTTAAFDNILVGRSNPAFSLTNSGTKLKGVAGATVTTTLLQSWSGAFTSPVSLSVSGLPNGATAQFSPATITGSGTSTLVVNLAPETPAGPYLLVVTGTTLNLSASTTIPLIVKPANNLPAGWSYTDVGDPAITGGTQFGAGAFTVQGSGDLISEDYDDFQFAYTKLSGDGSIVARLVNVTSTSPASQAGILFRRSLDSGSSVAFLFAQNNVNAIFWNRISSQADVAEAGMLKAQTPEWLKLVRQGNSITAYLSQDGTQWTQVGEAVTLDMGTEAYVGLGVSSGDDMTLTSATFDNVMVAKAGDLTLSPTTSTFTVNQTQQFTASFGNAAVSWAISPNVGTISGSGLYTAPAMISSRQNVTVTATSTVDSTQSASATMTLLPPVIVSVNPTSGTLAANQTQQFTATVANTSNMAVTWTISPNVGSISSGGLYTAPTNIASQQIVTVLAASVADPTKPASATVTLTAPAPPAACQVAYTNSNDWGSGFTGGLSITNSGSATLNGWTLTWTWPGNQQMTQSWNANYAQSETAVTLTNADSNSTIAAGATITGIGFNANYSGTNAAPTAFSLNGSPCSGPGGANLTPPASPTNLSATAVSSSQVNLTWTASTTAGVTYNVYAGTSPGVTASAAWRVASGLTGTNFQQQGTLASTTYYYVVTAVNGSSESSTSNQASTTTGGASCQVSYANQNDWGTGFTGSVSITNTSSSVIQGWTLTWQWPGNQQITGAWNASSAQSGASVTLTNAGFNSTIAPGATVSGIGFNANYSGANTPPAAFYMNGVPCQ